MLVVEVRVCIRGPVPGVCPGVGFLRAAGRRGIECRGSMADGATPGRFSGAGPGVCAGLCPWWASG